MGNLLADGAAWLSGQRHAHVAGTVTYMREAETVELSATVGATRFERDDEAGMTTVFESRDYIVRAADLVLAGVRETPRRGDKVRETIGGVVHVFEVLAPPGEEVYRWCDPTQVDLRIHTKHVGTE